MRYFALMILVFVGMAVFGCTGPKEADADTPSFAVPTPPMPQYFRAACPDYPDDMTILGCAYIFDEEGSDRYNQAYCRKGAGPTCFWHEIGHYFDKRVLSDAHRAKFIELIKYPTQEWWGGYENVADAGELFADAYETCAMQHLGRPRFAIFFWDRQGRPQSVAPNGYGYEVTYRRHQRVCQLIWNAAGRHYTYQRVKMHGSPFVPAPDPYPGS